ncbi:MAG: S8 family serine peptidase [Bacteroidales bacterium]|nr:S8 family serine peptidase [Bacteroidales bacterium]
MSYFNFTFRVISAVIFLSSLFQDVLSQEKYWVFFNDKKDCSLDPYTYFDPKAIERRLKFGIPLVSETDLPLNSRYVSEVEKACGKIISSSRWMNAVTVNLSKDNFNALNRMDFVREIQPVAKYKNYSLCDYHEEKLSNGELELLKKQVQRMGASHFEEKDINGRGIRIAVFDGGFPDVDNHSCFEHIRKDGRIISTYDFVKDRENVYSASTHGTMVLSCIAGIHNGQGMGLATGAEFLLARTEQKSEPFSEEENWLAAMEWADKNGADIISSSLGYTHHRYFPGEMDGKSSLVVKAATIAAKKGILVVNAMGNEGSKRWEFLGTPADADSIISVGGINPDTDYHISFSSYGPTADMRPKPNVTAYGRVIAAKKTGVAQVEGTSFSTPLVAGFAACIMQLNPDMDNMQIFRLIEQSGHLYPYYDYAHGYGIPQAGFFFKDSIIKQVTVNFEQSGDSILVKIPENIDLESDSLSHMLFYHIENETGVLDKYAVVQVDEHNVLTFLVNPALKNKTLRVHFRGTTIEHKFISE